MGSRGAASRAPRAGRVCSHSSSKPQRLICLVYSPATHTHSNTQTREKSRAQLSQPHGASGGGHRAARLPNVAALPLPRATPRSSPHGCGAARPAPRPHTHTATQRAVHTPRACRLLRQADGWGRPCSRDRPRALGPRLPTARAALVPVAEETPCAVVAYSQPFLTRSGRLHPTVVGLRAESTFCLPFASAKALGRLTAPNCGSPRAWGRERGPASDGERRGEARGGQSRPETTPCAAVSVVDEQRCAEPRTVRRARAAGGHRAGEPAPREGAWAGRAGSRGEALWSLGAARDGDGRRQAAGAHAGCREPAVARR